MFYNLIRTSTKRKGHTIRMAESIDENEKEANLKLNDKEIISYRSSVKLKKKYEM